MNSNLSENLKKIRKDNNLSQEDLASLLGVSRQAISKWESKVSYPEMDKIVLICKKFNLNMDDLLHKDLKEVKEIEKAPNKINEYFDNIVTFFVNSFELFYRMTFNTKLKFILEEVLIVFLLFLFWLLGAKLGSVILFSMLKKIPRDIYGIIYNIFSSLYLILGLIFNIIIVLKLYKVRYYDAYVSLRKDGSFMIENGESVVKNSDSKDNNAELKDLPLSSDAALNDNSFNQNLSINQPKIIIKNTSTGDDMFFNLLTKIIIGLLKAMLIPIIGVLAFTLVSLIICLICSFLILKSKLFFAGVFISIIALAILNIVVLIFLLNLIFNRQSKIRLMLNAFLGSLILLGMGLGFSLVSLVGFSNSLTSQKYWQTKNTEVSMQDNLFINATDSEEINFVEVDSDNVRIEYSINEACHIDDKIHLNGGLYLRSSCTNKNLIFKEIIDSINNNEIYNFSANIHNINNVTVYANSKNLKLIKDNMAS